MEVIRCICFRVIFSVWMPPHPFKRRHCFRTSRGEIIIWFWQQRNSLTAGWKDAYCVLDACQMEGKQAAIKEVMFMHARCTSSVQSAHHVNASRRRLDRFIFVSFFYLTLANSSWKHTNENNWEKTHLWGITNGFRIPYFIATHSQKKTFIKCALDTWPEPITWLEKADRAEM